MLATDRTRKIEALQGLLDELCSPDLTLARANVLRPQLFELLGMLNQSAPEKSDGSLSGPEQSAAGGPEAGWERASRGILPVSLDLSPSVFRMTRGGCNERRRIPSGA